MHIDHALMLVKCPHCDFSKNVDEGKIPLHAKRVLCPKCHQKFNLPLKKSDLDFESPGNRSRSHEHKHSSSFIKKCPNCGQRNRLPSHLTTDVVYKCGTCKHVLYQRPSIMTCPKCQREQNTSDECVYCGIVISKFFITTNRRSEKRQGELEKDRVRSENIDKAIQCIDRGKPIEVIDLLGNILSIPSKLLMLSGKVDIHVISSDTEAYILEFLMHHKLYDVKVRLNRYDPRDEFLRIKEKSNMNIVIRIFFWFISAIAYSLNPGRLFGGDYYNPATNSVNIFSNHVGIALHELGHALDFSRRAYPGLYQLIRLIPFVALYHEYKASQYAIQFLKSKKHHEEEISAYRILYPAYSTYVFGPIFELFPSPVMVWQYIPFIIAGHVTGFIHATFRKKRIPKGVTERPGETREIVKEKIGKKHLKLDIKKLIAMIIGFLTGSYFFNFWGGIIGAISAYYLIHEALKYRTTAQHN